MVLPTYVEHGQIAVSDDEEVLRCYFSDISDSEPLSREREVELALSIQGGDMDARNELIRCNLRFVVDVARRYRNRGLGFAELISAGNISLITAAERFDGSRGYKFISYERRWTILEKPTMAFMGVRISWEILATKSLFAWLAARAWSIARSSSTVR